jgi:hypothetical protein
VVPAPDGLAEVPKGVTMSHLELAIFLLTAVICVIAATRPERPRRRPAPTRPPSDRPATDEEDPRVTTSEVVATAPFPRLRSGQAPGAYHRNHWDRDDLAAAVGRDHEVAEIGLLLWPPPKEPAR